MRRPGGRPSSLPRRALRTGSAPGARPGPSSGSGSAHSQPSASPSRRSRSASRASLTTACAPLTQALVAAVCGERAGPALHLGDLCRRQGAAARPRRDSHTETLACAWAVGPRAGTRARWRVQVHFGCSSDVSGSFRRSWRSWPRSVESASSRCRSSCCRGLPRSSSATSSRSSATPRCGPARASARVRCSRTRRSSSEARAGSRSAPGSSTSGAATR